MGFFSRGESEDPEQAEAIAQIERGGIPPRAEKRLRVLATEGAMFTSGLSVNEFALLERGGPQPLAQVMGASVVRVGWQYLPALAPGVVVNTGPWYSMNIDRPSYSGRYTEASFAQIRSYMWHETVVCELDVLTGAWATVRRRALDRLRQEALVLGADAVIGVHLQHSDHDLGKEMIEYVVTGTAVRLPGTESAPTPILTDLSVQDYWRLTRAGYEPAGLLATTAVTFASASRATRLQRVRTKPQNQELHELSRAFNTAREKIRSRLEGQVADAHATGAVGVELSHSVHREKLALASSIQSGFRRGWQRGSLGLPRFVSGRTDIERRGWVITMHAAGTAIRRQHEGSMPDVRSTIRMGRS